MKDSDPTWLEAMKADAAACNARMIRDHFKSREHARYTDRLVARLERDGYDPSAIAYHAGLTKGNVHKVLSRLHGRESK